MFMLDDVLTDATTPLLPHKNVYDMSRPMAISNVMAIPKPVIANMNNWYYAPVPENNTAAMQRFLA